MSPSGTRAEPPGGQEQQQPGAPGPTEPDPAPGSSPNQVHAAVAGASPPSLATSARPGAAAPAGPQAGATTAAEGLAAAAGQSTPQDGEPAPPARPDAAAGRATGMPERLGARLPDHAAPVTQAVVGAADSLADRLSGAAGPTGSATATGTAGGAPPQAGLAAVQQALGRSEPTGQAAAAVTRATAGAGVDQPAPLGHPGLSGPTAPTPAAGGTTAVPPSGPHVTPQDLAQQVTRHLTGLRTLTDGTHRTVLHLAPEHLGELTLTVDVRAGTVALAMSGQDTALTVLRDGLNQLRDALARSGLDLGQVSMTVADPGSDRGRDPQQDKAFGAQDDRAEGDGRDASGGTRSDRSVLDGDDASRPNPAVVRAGTQPGAGLDLSI